MQRAEQRAMDERAAAEAEARAKQEAREAAPARRSNRQGIGEAMLKSAARAVGSSLGRKFVRGILGSLLK